MKTLALLIGAVALALIFLNPQSAQTTAAPRQIPVAAPTAQPPAQAQPTPSGSTKEGRLAFLCNPDGSVRPLRPEFKPLCEDVWGRIYQQLENGRIVMESNLGFISLIYHGNGEFIDGQFIGKFKGLKVGTYKLPLASGGTRTILEVLYIPPEALPGAPVFKPGPFIP